MIEQNETMTLLAEACPSFQDTWHQHLQENGNELLYMAAGQFAHHLLALHKTNDLSSFPAVGAAIELLLVEGSPWVKEFATIGVLEAIQNVWVNNDRDPEQFRQFLGIESLQWWEGINKFWASEAKYVGPAG